MASEDRESILAKKKRICSAGRVAVNELIKVAEESILSGRLNPDNTTDDGLAADKLTRAAQAKKLAIFDAFEILAKVEEVEKEIEDIENPGKQKDIPGDFTAKRAK